MAEVAEVGSWNPCGAYCAPPPGIIGAIPYLSQAGQVPQWYIDQVTQGQVNLAYPGAPSVDPNATTIWVNCGGTLSSVSCDPPPQAANGRTPFSTNLLYPGLAPGDIPVGFDIWHCPGCGTTWRNASGAANTLLVATGAIVGANGIAMVGPALTALARPWFGVLSTTALNPNSIGFAMDFLSGWTPASFVPASYGGFAGLGTNQLYQWWTNR